MYLTQLDRGPRQRRALNDHTQSANAHIQEDRRIIVSEVGQLLGIRQTAETIKEDCCQKLFNCTMTMLPPPPPLLSMLRSQQYRQFEASSSMFCHIHITTSTSHRVTLMSLVHYVVTGLVAKQCIHGFGNSLKRAPPKESGRLWTDKKKYV